MLLSYFKKHLGNGLDQIFRTRMLDYFWGIDRHVREHQKLETQNTAEVLLLLVMPQLEN